MLLIMIILYPWGLATSFLAGRQDPPMMCFLIKHDRLPVFRQNCGIPLGKLWDKKGSLPSIILDPPRSLPHLSVPRISSPKTEMGRDCVVESCEMQEYIIRPLDPMPSSCLLKIYTGIFYSSFPFVSRATLPTLINHLPQS